MLKRFWLSTVCALLGMCSLSAYVHPYRGQWAVDLEYLYLLPSVDDTYFVIQSPDTTTANGTRVNNDFGFHSGFRVGGTYALCDCNQELQVYYTYLKADQSKTVSGALLATLGWAGFAETYTDYIGTASSDLHLLYQRVDGFFAQQVFCACDLDLYLRAGVEYAYTRLREQYFFNDGSPNPGEVDEFSRNWGVGPQFGVEFDYNLCEFSCFCPGTLSIAAFTSGSILATKTQTNQQNYSGSLTTPVNLTDDDTWRLVPAWHARVGLNYATCLWCHPAALEVGYEFNTYVRGLTRFALADSNAAGFCMTEYYNFDVQGLYVSLAMAF